MVCGSIGSLYVLNWLCAGRLLIYESLANLFSILNNLIIFQLLMVMSQIRDIEPGFIIVLKISTSVGNDGLSTEK